jgi:sorbitol-6-phosphate 2-dehydrogenase
MVECTMMTTVEYLPLLRGLLSVDGRLPLLRRARAARGPGLRLPGPDASDPDALLRAWRPPIERARRPVRAVTIGGAGAYAVSLPTPRSGRAAGKACLVTGAAQGVGFEIAADLVAQGASVALADVNGEGVTAAARRLNSGRREPAAFGIAMNVADEAAVRAGVAEAVGLFGGLDLLVSNAGVLRAGSVLTQPVADFDFVTAVNYRGYFLCVQAAAPVMARQHRACPAAWADIVQINSKSGLQGSNRNGAYAGSKFGGIGLTQSFALELIADGIKVNAICPGNFFDGPLWSDPEKGLFVQYLRTGKVPGAASVADVRRFYETKVPMGRGCTPQDVMRALYYLVEQHYETGQALPVTGGQVMLG